MFNTMVSVPALLDAISVTPNWPGVLYVITGLASVELEGVPPGNNHAKVVALGDERLLYCTVRDVQPVVGVALKAAVGGVMMVTVWVAVEVPQAFVAVNTTVYVPSLV